MKTLKDYARYLRESRLKDFTVYYLALLKEADIPLIKLAIEKGLVKDMWGEAAFIRTMERQSESLLALEDGSVIARAKENLKLWEQDKLPGITKNDILPADLILIYAILKKSIFHFLPDFTNDLTESLAIVQEVEDLYTGLQNDAMHVLFKIQKSTLEKLQETETIRERLLEIIEASTDFIGFADIKDRHIKYMNRNGRKMIGIPENEDAEKFKVNDVHPEWVNEKLENECIPYAIENGIWKGETAFLTQDGKEIPVSMILMSHKNSDNQVEFISTISRDITEEKLMEERFRQIVRNVKDYAIFMLDSKGYVQTWNEGIERIKGYKAEEILGKHISLLYTEEDKRKGIPEHNLKIAEKIGSFESEGLSVRKDGSTFWANSIYTAIYGPNKKLTGFSKITRDITEQKKAADELKSLNKELERSNSELEQFAYVASHDLQEPLRTISSYVQLLAERYKDKIDKDANEFIDFAVDGSNRMRLLINSLLEYSRVNKIKPFEPLEPDAIIREVLQDMNDQISESEATVKFKNLPEIYGDPVLIGQLFQNLIGNAIKFKGENKPEIKIAGKRENGEYKFSVEDNGIGINNEYAEKIFVIFQRLNSREKYPGTGIGLSICKKIVERHGGRIWVESKPGKGSVFYFTIKADL